MELTDYQRKRLNEDYGDGFIDSVSPYSLDFVLSVDELQTLNTIADNESFGQPCTQRTYLQRGDKRDPVVDMLWSYGLIRMINYSIHDSFSWLALSDKGLAYLSWMNAPELTK